jgi:5'-3' exonuclease
MKVHIDTDIFVYRIGFGLKDFDLFENIEALEKSIKDVKDKFPEHEHRLVISNTERTFRHDVAVTVPYKGNRKADKPKFYKELRDFLIEELGAEVSPQGFEADDSIGMSVDRKTDIIATIDKDLFMIPAKGHYNFVKNEMIKIKRPAYYFWKQMLTGDVADNIKGLTLIGDKRATALLEESKTKNMRKVVEDEYKREFGDDWFKRFDENGRLLWIKRHADKEYYDYV